MITAENLRVSEGAFKLSIAWGFPHAFEKLDALQNAIAQTPENHFETDESGDVNA